VQDGKDGKDGKGEKGDKGEKGEKGKAQEAKAGVWKTCRTWPQRRDESRRLQF